MRAHPNDHADRRPGRPRDERADAAIRDAALTLVGRCGPAGLRMDAVASRAGVSKATLYRRFPSRATLLAALLDDVFRESGPLPNTGSFERDLYLEIRRITAIAGDPTTGPPARAFLLGNDQVPELRAVLDEAVLRLHRRLTTIARRAAARHELARQPEPERLLDNLLGPLLMRWLVCGVPPDDRYAKALAHQVAQTILRTPRR